MNEIVRPSPPTLRSLTLTSGLSPTPNSGHMATHRFAQIQPNGWTSYVRETLSEMAGLRKKK
jgi:hypothetical protein